MLQRFLELIDAAPTAAALIDGRNGDVVTRAALLARARAIARTLDANGLREGDLVALQLPNSPDFVAAILAALERKLVIVPIDRDATEAEVGAILGHFDIKASSTEVAFLRAQRRGAPRFRPTRG